MEWCQDVMVEEMKMLKRLHRLQTTSANLPKEKVLSKIRNYLQLLGIRIDQIVSEKEDQPSKQDRMNMRLWKLLLPFPIYQGRGFTKFIQNLNWSTLQQVLAPLIPMGQYLVPLAGMENLVIRIHFQGQPHLKGS
ncbi:protein CHROMATIN REMODELING 5-like isoform X4 [Cicer arietinum]|uniref:protein CHROMATIN REMODELING 5-like isoform X4 n=1 Tax=Cicer arietinum TaxID=3827 RepID=UPI00032AA441